MDNEEIRLLIEREVDRKMDPVLKSMGELKTLFTIVSKKLDSFNHWKLSLWSNGSGGPPGYLERARADDDKRYGDLLQAVTELKRKDIQEETTEKVINDLKEEKRKNVKARLDKFSVLITLLGSGAGAFLLHLIQELLGKH